MSFATDRRGVLRLMTSGLAASAVLGLHPAAAAGLVSAFAQGLSAAAQDDEVLSAFYSNRNYAPLWTSDADVARRQALFDALDTAGLHGLPEPRYDAKGLRAKFAAAQTEGDLGRLDVDMSRTYLAFVRDMTSGAIVPSKVTADIKREIAVRDPALVLAAAAGDVAGYLATLPPTAPQYARLMKEKFALEAIIAKGGFGAKLGAAELAPGLVGAAVVALRDRLMTLGYLDRSFTESYDPVMADAVQRFQLDHGLTADGVANNRTIDALNVGAEDRLKSVVVAMERLRWMGDAPLGARHIWVNQPDFVAKVVDDGKVTFRTRVVIGKVGADTESPEFSELMEYMVVNPTWSVPRSITVKEYLPMLQRNRNAQGQLQVIDGAGRVVPRSAINFASYTTKNFPFALRQPPSDGNALGKVKFMFPNPYNIYLHDTPSKSLFDKEVRAFSHGCIRVGSPFDLAYTLLTPQSDDPQGLFETYLETGRESVLNFTTPIPVHLVYFTAWPNDQGKISYAADIYGRDAMIFAALTEAGVALPGIQS
jgi:murein L,D-transpeptidase YcbB/YkuD